MKGRAFLIAGGLMMILLGVARGAGGAILLARGPAADPGIQASPSSVLFLGVLLVVLAAGLIASAVGVLARSRRSCLWGAGLVFTFVLDGVLNGYLLYGRPGARGTTANLTAAALILLCLFLGRGALEAGAYDRAAAT